MKLKNIIKYGTKEIIRELEEMEDGRKESIWNVRLNCLCGNKMTGSYRTNSEIPEDFECEKCGNITFDKNFHKNSRFIAPTFSIDFKNSRGFGVSRVNASVFVDYDKEKGVKSIELLKTNMSRKVVFDIVDRTLICYKNGEVEYDFKKEGSEYGEFDPEILNSINNFVLRNVPVEHFIKQIGTEGSIPFYEFTNKIESASNKRTNKRILHRFRAMLINRDKFEYAQILSNAGFKNIKPLSEMNSYSRSSENYNAIRRINKEGKTPSQILNVPKSVVRKLLDIKQGSNLSYYYMDNTSRALYNFYNFHNEHRGVYDMNIVNNILNATNDSEGLLKIFDNISTIYNLISTPEYKRNQKRAIEYLTQDLLMYQGISDINSAVTLLYDYSDMVKKMGGVPERYPKSLKKVHDVAMLNYKKWRSNLTKEDFLIATKRYSHLQDFSQDKKYSFIVPETIGDLIKEGNSLNHCIASYDNRVIDGSSQIVFMRDKKDIEKPLISIEIRRGVIKQARGFSNRDTTKEENLAMAEWAERNDIVY